MIDHVITLSLRQADEWLLNRRLPQDYRAPLPWAWIGFESPGAKWMSPLRHANLRLSLIVPMNDIDPEGRAIDRLRRGEDEPSIEQARRIVDFVTRLHKAKRRYALIVHCHAGLYRSGAVAEWVSRHFDVPEDEASHRLVVFGAKERSYNHLLLRLLEQACAENADCRAFGRTP